MIAPGSGILKNHCFSPGRCIRPAVLHKQKLHAQPDIDFSRFEALFHGCTVRNCTPKLFCRKETRLVLQLANLK